MGSCVSNNDDVQDPIRKGKNKRSHKSKDLDSTSRAISDADSVSSDESGRGGRGGGGRKSSRLTPKGLSEEEIQTLFFNPMEAAWNKNSFDTPIKVNNTTPTSHPRINESGDDPDQQDREVQDLPQQSQAPGEGEGERSSQQPSASLSNNRPATLIIQSANIPLPPPQTNIFETPLPTTNYSRFQSKEELQQYSWYTFLCDQPQALDAIKTNWHRITGEEEPDPRVLKYCDSAPSKQEAEDRWRNYIMQELVMCCSVGSNNAPVGGSNNAAGGGGPQSSLTSIHSNNSGGRRNVNHHRRLSYTASLPDIDDLYLRVVASNKNSHHHPSPQSSISNIPSELLLVGGGAPAGTESSEDGGGVAPMERSQELLLSHRTTGSNKQQQQPTSLAELGELYETIIDGQLFEPLMKELRITKEAHLLYLFSKLLVYEQKLTPEQQEQQKLIKKASKRVMIREGDSQGPAQPARQQNSSTSAAPSVNLVRLPDQWSISLTSWRLGWLTLGCGGGGGSTSILTKVERIKNDYELLKVDDQDFSRLYLFLWSFANSEILSSCLTSAAPSAAATPLNSARGSPETRVLSPSTPGSMNNLRSPNVPLVPSAGTGGNFNSASSPVRKVLPKDDALMIWTTAVGPKWAYTEPWCQYCEDKEERIGGRSHISIDQWRQLLEFMTSFTSPQHFANHDSAMSSWPGVLDDFVDWMQRKGGAEYAPVETSSSA